MCIKHSFSPLQYNLMLCFLQIIYDVEKSNTLQLTALKQKRCINLSCQSYMEAGVQGQGDSRDGLQENEISYWLYISCISVTRVSPWLRPFRRQDAVLSPFILMGEINVITDCDQFFCPIVTKMHTRPVFHKVHFFKTFWHKNGIFHTHKSGENWLCSRPVSVSATHSHKIWELVLSCLASRWT